MGSGWADAIFRYQSDNAKYAEEMIMRVIRKMIMNVADFHIYFSEADFLLLKKENCQLKMSYQLVEALRCEDVFAYEKYVEDHLNHHDHALN